MHGFNESSIGEYLQYRYALKQRGTIYTMRVELIGHFKPCVTEIYLHI